MKIFQKAALSILFFYIGLMFFVAIFAHLKPSGSTGMDMMKIHGQLQKKTYHEKMANDEKIVENP